MLVQCTHNFIGTRGSIENKQQVSKVLNDLLKAGEKKWKNFQNKTFKDI